MATELLSACKHGAFAPHFAEPGKRCDDCQDPWCGYNDNGRCQGGTEPSLAEVVEWLQERMSTEARTVAADKLGCAADFSNEDMDDMTWDEVGMMYLDALGGGQ